MTLVQMKKGKGPYCSIVRLSMGPIDVRSCVLLCFSVCMSSFQFQVVCSHPDATGHPNPEGSDPNPLEGSDPNPLEGSRVSHQSLWL